MEKIIVFFCDIYGTIKGNINNLEEDYLKLNSILNSISKQNDDTKILFVLISTESENVVKQFYNTLTKYFSENILFGRQFHENGYLINDSNIEVISGKCNNMISYMKEISKWLEIVKVYYIDDSYFLQEMLQECTKLTFPNVEIESIIPTNGFGLSEVNQLLEKHISKKY